MIFINAKMELEGVEPSSNGYSFKNFWSRLFYRYTTVPYNLNLDRKLMFIRLTENGYFLQNLPDFDKICYK